MWGLLAVSILVTILKNAMCNRFGKQNNQSAVNSYYFNAACCALACIMLLAAGFPIGMASAYTVLSGSFFGLMWFAASLSYTLALQTGPLGYTTLMASAGMLVPVAFGCFFWHEPVLWSQLAGVALILASLYFGVNPKKDKQITVKWLVLASCCLFTNGMLGVLQKIFQASAHAGEADEMLAISLAVSAALSFLAGLLVKRRTGQKKSFSLAKNWLVLLGAALGFALPGKVNLILAGSLPAVLFFPVFNGAVLLLTTLLAAFLFKEKLTRVQTWAMAGGILAIVLLSGAVGI